MGLSKHLKFLQDKMAKAHDCHSKVDNEFGPAGSTAGSTANFKMGDLSAQMRAVKKAVAEAKVASKSRVAEKKKLTAAELKEKTKLKAATKAKKDLQTKMSQVNGMKAKLEKQAAALKSQQAAASTKQKLVASKLKSAKASITKLQEATTIA